MAAPAIVCRDLGKRYRIGGSHVTTLRERLLGRGAAAANDLWALREVAFDVAAGEVVGVIGRNGAGKSTLLKILSRVTTPTVGEARLSGRVGSLLEVGTGFHPELTGRENVFLNGAILGMRRDEIAARFDAIVDFAETERFLDTPVKHYSSGMYMRLAFAVAAHLDCEVLLVDEVLAVGDAAFQRKCLGRMGDVARSGRTVLFVSHNLAAVQHLCARTLVFADGRLDFDGPSETAVARYAGNLPAAAAADLGARADRQGDGRLRFLRLRWQDSAGNAAAPQSGAAVQLALDVRVTAASPLREVELDVGLLTPAGAPLLILGTALAGTPLTLAPGTHTVVCTLARWPLSLGSYHVNLFARAGGEILDWLTPAGTVEVAGGDFFGSGRLPPTTHRGVLVEHHWRAQP